MTLPDIPKKRRLFTGNFPQIKTNRLKVARRTDPLRNLTQARVIHWLAEKTEKLIRAYDECDISTESFVSFVVYLFNINTI